MRKHRKSHKGVHHKKASSHIARASLHKDHDVEEDKSAISEKTIEHSDHSESNLKLPDSSAVIHLTHVTEEASHEVSKIEK
jgi:hypothetical protein